MQGLREFLITASRGGGRNFRTIGDWVTMQGHRVVTHRVFRSGHLGELTEQFRAELPKLGVRTVVTFQTRQEIDLLGDPLPKLLPDAVWEHIPIGDRWFSEGTKFPTDAASQGRFYVSMIRDHPEHWARFLRLFGRDERFPILYHCTAGRDRTGVATVLLLETVGVTREEIVTDYLLSNDAFDSHAQEAAVLDPLFGFIDGKGGIETLLSDLGLHPGEIDAIRTNLVAIAETAQT